MTAVNELPNFPFPDGPLGSPPHEYAERRATCPFGEVRLPSGDRGVLLVTYEDVAAALADPRLSHNLTAPNSPRIVEGPSALDDPELLLNKEGAEHLRIRRIIASTFTPRRVEEWKPTIQTVAAELIDAIEQSDIPVDLVAGYGIPLPIRIICQLLGIPEQDAARFRDWSMALASAVRMDPAERGELLQTFWEYVRELIARRREESGTSLIDNLIAARDGEEKLTERELEYLIMTLIAAGNETTSNILGRSLLVLLRDDGALWKQLVAAPELVPAAVDELLRYNPLGNGGTLRIATDRVELPSGTVEKGQAVFIAGSSAMRDERIYSDPDTVRFDRESIPLLAFGAGPHYCVGAHLAKAELRIAFAELIRRLPDLRLAISLDEIRFTEGDIMRSVIALPAAF